MFGHVDPHGRKDRGKIVARLRIRFGAGRRCKILTIKFVPAKLIALSPTKVINASAYQITVESLIIPLKCWRGVELSAINRVRERQFSYEYHCCCPRRPTTMIECEQVHVPFKYGMDGVKVRLCCSRVS